MAVIEAAGISQTGIYEPTMAHLSEKPSVERSGDTVHLDVIDRWGNMVSATPSGGWLQSSPTVPSLGRSEEHTSELQSLMRISYAVFCLKKQKKSTHKNQKYI